MPASLPSSPLQPQFSLLSSHHVLCALVTQKVSIFSPAVPLHTLTLGSGSPSPTPLSYVSQPPGKQHTQMPAPAAPMPLQWQSGLQKAGIKLFQRCSLLSLPCLLQSIPPSCAFTPQKAFASALFLPAAVSQPSSLLIWTRARAS